MCVSALCLFLQGEWLLCLDLSEKMPTVLPHLVRSTGTDSFDRQLLLYASGVAAVLPFLVCSRCVRGTV